LIGIPKLEPAGCRAEGEEDAFFYSGRKPSELRADGNGRPEGDAGIKLTHAAFLAVGRRGERFVRASLLKKKGIPSEDLIVEPEGGLGGRSQIGSLSLTKRGLIGREGNGQRLSLD